MNSDFSSEIQCWFDDILKNIEVLTDELYTKFKRISNTSPQVTKYQDYCFQINDKRYSREIITFGVILN